MGERFRYNPTRCYQTFPFPASSDDVAQLGQSYWQRRNAAMDSRHEGLTDFYNRFHRSDDESAEIEELRALHAELDRAVATAYGWRDLDMGHGFHQTKEGLRFTISPVARRSVLDRLVALNHLRYAEEVKAGLHQKSAKKTRAKNQRRTPSRFDLLS